MSSGAIQKSSGAETKGTALSSGETTSGTQSLHCVKVPAHERYQFRCRNQGSRRNRINTVTFRRKGGSRSGAGTGNGSGSRAVVPAPEP